MRLETLAFAPFGTANPPSSISMNTPTYSSLTLSGLGAPHVASTSGGLDNSLFTAYNSLPLSVINVQYGVDVETTPPATANRVQDTSTNPAAVTQSKITSQTNLQAWSIPLSSMVHPEYEISTVAPDPVTGAVTSYYAQKNDTGPTPSGGASDVKVYATSALKASKYIPIPSRSQAGAADYLPSSGSIDGTRSASGSGLAGVVTAHQRGAGGGNAAYASNSNVIFIEEVSVTTALTTITFSGSKTIGINFGDSNSSLPSSATDPFVAANSALGKLIQNNHILSDLLHELKRGATIIGTHAVKEIIASRPHSGSWTATGAHTGHNQTHQSTVETNGAHISFDISQLRDGGSGDIKTEGYYLEADVDAHTMLVDENYTEDIGAHSYQPYKLSLRHRPHHNGSTSGGTISLSSISNTIESADIKIAVARRKDIASSNKNATLAPILPNGWLYGQTLPQDIVIELSFDLTDIDQYWAPSSTGNIWAADLKLGGSTSVDSTQNKRWNQTAQNTTLNIVGSGSSGTKVRMKYDNATVGNCDYNANKYSRDVTGAHQFTIEVDVDNNIFTPSPSTSADFTLSSSSDFTSFTNVWWDATLYTYSGSTSAGSVHNTFAYAITTNTGTVKLQRVDSTTTATIGSLPFTQQHNLASTTHIPGSTSTNASGDFDHTEEIDDECMVWSKDGWYGAYDSSVSITTTGSTKPWIDYTLFYNSYGGSNVMRDYSGKKTTGSGSKTWTVPDLSGSGTFSGGCTNLKWLMFRVENPSVSGGWTTCKVVITDTAGNDMVAPAKTGAGYHLWYMEAMTGGSGAAFEWLDAAGNKLPNSTGGTLHFFSTWCSAEAPVGASGATKIQCRTFTEGLSVNGASTGCRSPASATNTECIISKKNNSSTAQVDCYFCIGFDELSSASGAVIASVDLTFA